MVLSLGQYNLALILALFFALIYFLRVIMLRLDQIETLLKRGH